MPETQICRDCGQPFPYNPDADRCDRCVAAPRGDDDRGDPDRRREAMRHYHIGPNEATMITALIHYSLHVADPSMCVEALKQLQPAPLRPGEQIIEDARTEYRQVFDRIEATT